MSILFFITYAIWLFSEIWLSRSMKSDKNDVQDADKYTLRIIWITIAVCIFLSVRISFNLDHLISGNYSFQYGGLFLIWIGIVSRMLVIRSLGRFFTVDVTIRQGHQLKTDGFFRFVRHPSYLAALVSFFGFGLSLNNWFSLGIIFVPVFIAFLVRIRVEEKVLIKEFGSEYLNYKKRTSRIIPFVY